MKLLLKIVFSPVLLVLWIICGICNVFIKASAVVLSFIAILFALAGVITIITGSVGKGIAGLVIAFLLSPYGIPMLAALVLAAVKLYRPKLRLIRLLAGVLVAWYLCLSALNLDAIIAKSVLADAARKGGLTERNADFLRYELSEDAHNVLLESPLREQIYYDVAPEGE